MAFEFKEKKILDLQIASASFRVKLDAAFLEKVRQIGNKLVAYGRDPATSNDTLEDQFAFACDRIDDMLGDGAADAIFAGHEDADAMDAFDVLEYITKEVANAQQNRYQRRTTTPAKQNKPSSSKKRRYKGNHK